MLFVLSARLTLIVITVFSRADFPVYLVQWKTQ